MRNIVTLYPEKENIPMSKRQLRVAAYCRVSTEHGEQDGSIELQEEYFQALIDGNLFEGKQIVNNGELDRVLIQNHHQGIIDRKLFTQLNGSDR